MNNSQEPINQTQTFNGKGQSVLINDYDRKPAKTPQELKAIEEAREYVRKRKESQSKS